MPDRQPHRVASSCRDADNAHPRCRAHVQAPAFDTGTDLLAAVRGLDDAGVELRMHEVASKPGASGWTPRLTARIPIIARIRAIDTELATRAATAQSAGSPLP